MIDSRKLADVIAGALLDKKGKDVVILDVRGLTTLTDYFVVCHGTSETQIKALADSVDDKTLEKLSEKPWKREGFDARLSIMLPLSFISLVLKNGNFMESNACGTTRSESR
jgi:ribosome-associated protein